MPESIKILIVEDELSLVRILSDALTVEGYTVVTAPDGEQGLLEFIRCRPALVIADIMMPRLDGYAMVKQIRRRSTEVKILFLSARSASDDVVQGFDYGANDYLRKPFAIDELLVRVRELISRSPMQDSDPPEYYQLGSAEFDPKRWTIRWSDTLQSLSNRESQILEYLCRESGEVVPSQLLLKDVWGDDSVSNARSLNVYITHLRHYLECDPRIQIVNARGVGFKLEILD